MSQVKEMIQGLSPLARLDEMHPTLAKFSIPAGRELSERRPGSSESGGGGGATIGGGGGAHSTGGGGLSLSRAFETIEARKAELQARRGVGWGVGWCRAEKCGWFSECFFVSSVGSTLTFVPAFRQMHIVSVYNSPPWD